MARTYEEIKTVVDAANPTPAITWYLHADDPDHRFDDHAVAYTEMTQVDGHTVRYEAHVAGTGQQHMWHKFGVKDVDAPREFPGTFASWALLKAEIARDWEADNEAARARIATEILAREVSGR